MEFIWSLMGRGVFYFPALVELGVVAEKRR